MTRAVLSVGSNVGDRLAHLQSVVEGLGSAVQAVSPVYETPPWGDVEQGPFLNAVVVVEESGVDAITWLHRGQSLERAAHRERIRHWGPRTLDVDVVACRADDAEVVSTDPELTLPHPYAHERAFVLVPWLAVEPDATLTVAGTQRRVADLLDALPPDDTAGVRRTDLVLVRR